MTDTKPAENVARNSEVKADGVGVCSTPEETNQAQQPAPERDDDR
jgi:hypothetical protein